MSSIVAACRNCAFFEFTPEDDDLVGQCHRYPKLAERSVYSWCGEFEPKRVHYWRPNANSTLKPTIKWPGDDEDDDA